jgi:hypothetical protein
VLDLIVGEIAAIAYRITQQPEAAFFIQPECAGLFGKKRVPEIEGDRFYLQSATVRSNTCLRELSFTHSCILIKSGESSESFKSLASLACLASPDEVEA